MSSTDVESLQPASRQRSRCLDAFLLGSVITLFVMVLCGAALGFWVVKELFAQLERVPRAPEGILSALKNNHEGLPDLGSSYKMQNFAYFVATSSRVKNGIMEWAPINYSNTSSIGSRYRYTPNHHALTMVQEGTYFLYTQMNLSCTGPGCASGSLSITFEDSAQNEHLSCSLHLTFPGPSVKKCWTVIPHLPGEERLIARMRSNVPPEGWKLDLNHSGFGVFLVDGPGTEKEKKTGQTH